MPVRALIYCPLFTVLTGKKPTPSLRTAHVIACVLSSVSALSCVLGTTTYLKNTEMYVCDLDDFIRTHEHFQAKAVEGLFVLSILFTGLAIALGLPMVLDGIAGWITSALTLTSVATVHVFWFARAKLFARGERANTRREAQIYREVIMEIYDELYDSPQEAGAAAGEEAAERGPGSPASELEFAEFDPVEDIDDPRPRSLGE